MEETTSIIPLVGDLPGVTSYSFTAEDLDGEGTTRTEDGHMHREVILPNVIHASVTHRVTTENLAAICNVIKANTVISNLDLYLPGVPGRQGGRSYYCSKLTATLIISKEDTEWWDVSYELVEV